MSYILDAIRKSEHERQMRETPTLSALPNASPQTPKRPMWFWPVIILMSLNLIALVFWFSYKKNSASTLKVDTQTAVITPTHKTIPAEPKQPPIVANKPAPVEVTKNSNTPEKQSQSIADMLKTPTKPQPILKKTATTQPKRPKSTATQKPTKITAPIQTRAQQPLAQKQTSAIPYLHTLSQDFQARVPSLKMNIHMYSDNAKDSFAIINMTKYRSGEIISEGLKLEKITSNGLVLSFDDQTFQLNHP